MISIIIPCYNAEATLAATVQSALEQDVEHEVIVIDDGSTDRSPAVIEAFGNRIRSERTQNRGVSAARNRGTELARGNLFQYLDSDDLLVPGTLKSRKAALAATGADVACTNWQKLEPRPNGEFQAGGIVFLRMDRLAADAEAATATSDFWAPPAALLYRRDIVKSVGGWPSMSTCEDARFLFNVAANGARFVHVEAVGALYRVSPQSLSRRNKAQFIADCARNAREIETFWRSTGRLTAVRADALTKMWNHVAIASLTEGLPSFEEAQRRLLALQSRHPLIAVGNVLRRAVGAQRAARTVRLLLAGKHAVQSAATSPTNGAL